MARSGGGAKCVVCYKKGEVPLSVAWLSRTSSRGETVRLRGGGAKLVNWMDKSRGE